MESIKFTRERVGKREIYYNNMDICYVKIPRKTIIIYANFCNQIKKTVIL